MLQRNGVGASVSLAAPIHPEDAQPNEVSKKRKGQGLPPVVASTKPRISYNHRGRGAPGVRGGYGGRKSSNTGTPTQYATRGGGWKARGNPSGNWPRRVHDTFGSRHDPGSGSKPSSSVDLSVPTSPAAGPSRSDKGKSPIRGGERSVHKSWHRRDDATNQHRSTHRDEGVSPWGQKPDSGYGQHAAASRVLAPPNTDAPSHAPTTASAPSLQPTPVHPSLPPKPPSLPPKPPPPASPESPPQVSTFLFQPGRKDSKGTGTSEWYMRIGSPEPMLPPGSFGRKNSQPPSTISMPLPGRLRKLSMQDKHPVREANAPPPAAPSQPESIVSQPTVPPVRPKSQPAEPSQVSLPLDKPLDKPKPPSSKHLPAPKGGPIKKPGAERLPFVPPENASNLNVYKSVSLSEQRISRSKPPESHSTSHAHVPQSQSQKSKSSSQPQPQRDDKLPASEPSTITTTIPTSASTSTSTSLSQPTRHDARLEPPTLPKPSLTVPTTTNINTTKPPAPETDALSSFVRPQGSSGAYVPVPLSQQRQSRVPLYSIPSTPDPEVEDLTYPTPTPQQPSTVFAPTIVPQQQQQQQPCRPQPDLSSSSASRSQPRAEEDWNRLPADSSRVSAKDRVPAQQRSFLADIEDNLKSDAAASRSVATSRTTAPPTSLPTQTSQPQRKSAPLARESPVGHLPARVPPSELAEVRLVTPPRATPGASTSLQARTSAASPAVVVKKEEQLSPLTQSPIKPTRKLVTEAASFYPMPASCDKAAPDYKEKRKAFFKEHSRKLNSMGLKRTKAFFRDDGLVIEWKSDVPVWSDTLKPEESNLAIAMEEFLQRSASKKRKRNDHDTQAVRDLSPSAKRSKPFGSTRPPPSTGKRKILGSPEPSLPDKRSKTAAMDPSASSKDEAIYIFSSPESSPRPTSKALPSAPTKRVPLPTRLQPAKMLSGKLTSTPGAGASQSISLSNSKSKALTSISTVNGPLTDQSGPKGGSHLTTESVKVSGPTRNDPPGPVLSTVSQIDGHAVGSDLPPSSHRKMVFKPTNPSRTSRVTPAAPVPAQPLSSEKPEIEQFGVGSEHTPASNPAGPHTQSGTNLELKDGDSDIYCSEHEDDQEEEDDRLSQLAVDYFTRFITFFDSDRSKLAPAYAPNALFTCRVHNLHPHRPSVAEYFAPESKLVFHSYHSSAWASTVEHGRVRICDRLRAMGPHQFRALPGSVVYDLAPLPLDPPGHLMFSVHGEVVDPSYSGPQSNHILTVDQTFVLRPRTDDDNIDMSDSYDDEQWPLVAISHQMTVRESRLLPQDAIENILPWVADIGSLASDTCG